MTKRIAITHYSRPASNWEVKIENNIYSNVSNASIDRLNLIINILPKQIVWANFFAPDFFKVIYKVGN